MSLQIDNKLNYLLHSWPYGTVAVLPWLKTLGIKRQLVQKYEKSNWVKSIGRGAIVRPNQDVTWEGGLYAIQNLLKSKIHIGGKTALEIRGSAHFVPLGKAPVRLYGEPKEKLPKWFTDYDWGHEVRYYPTNLFSKNPDVGLTKRTFGTFELTMSANERAFFEVLYLIPDHQGIVEAQYLNQNLTTLRPNVVQELLECCSSIKVKRLFLFLADRQEHPWFKKLDLKKVDLGSGKRSIYKNGRLDKKYEITISNDFYEIQ